MKLSRCLLTTFIVSVLISLTSVHAQEVILQSARTITKTVSRTIPVNFSFVTTYEVPAITVQTVAPMAMNAPIIMEAPAVVYETPMIYTVQPHMMTAPTVRTIRSGPWRTVNESSSYCVNCGKTKSNATRVRKFPIMNRTRGLWWRPRTWNRSGGMSHDSHGMDSHMESVSFASSGMSG